MGKKQVSQLFIRFFSMIFQVENLRQRIGGHDLIVDELKYRILAAKTLGEGFTLGYGGSIVPQLHRSKRFAVFSHRNEAMLLTAYTKGDDLVLYRLSDLFEAGANSIKIPTRFLFAGPPLPCDDSMGRRSFSNDLLLCCIVTNELSTLRSDIKSGYYVHTFLRLKRITRKEEFHRQDW
ncbi:MAG: hypothetical protein BWY50_02069 [Spirochaetes bacterium ADurb.Bin315]|nr:MAG: hypothetical protein BWY50_02069 [Spirochaetes bacterium ADurb.Bin315]